MFKKFITREKTYFKKLNQNAQKLLITIFLYNLIGPIFGIFINAFLWRQTQSLMLVAMYNCISYAMVPAGFYLNGYIVRKFSPSVPYTISLIISGLAVATLMLLPAITITAVVIFSIVDGLMIGFYWSNRNLMTLKTTTTHDRIYFSSIETASSTITAVIIPAAIGWFITLGTPLHLYTTLQGYQLVIIYVLLIIIRLGYISKTIRTKKISIPVLFVKNVSSNWKQFRFIQFIYGLENAVDFFIPVLLVLILVGNEAALGTVQSVSAIIASLLIYKLGKSLNTKHRVRLIGLGVFFTIFGALLFGILYSALGIVIFYACQALAQQFSWVGGSSVNYDLIDVDNNDAKQHYAYVSDEEIYLNCGRVVGILLFMLLIVFASQSFALRFAPIIFAATQLLLLFAYSTIEKNFKKIPASLTAL